MGPCALRGIAWSADASVNDLSDYLVLAILIGVGLSSAWLTHYLSRPGARIQILDHPNERSLHENPTPRTGGLAMLLALILGILLVQWRTPLPEAAAWIAVAALLVAGISLAEDRFGVKRRYRLLAHVAAAGLMLQAGLQIGPPAGLPAAYPAALAYQLSTLFLVVWMINLYNFMDGMDGFAGGMALIGFGSLALAGYRAGFEAYALSAAVVAVAAAGFLRWNFPPARIFMGDSGSAMLGLLAAGFSLWAAQLQILPLWASLLVFSPFIVDASVTLLRRLLAGERIWQAHRTHYYQRLVRLGWGHRKTVLRAYLLMLACSVTALQGVDLQPGEAVWLLSMWAGIYALIAFKVHLMERRQRSGTA